MKKPLKILAFVASLASIPLITGANPPERLPLWNPPPPPRIPWLPRIPGIPGSGDLGNGNSWNVSFVPGGASVGISLTLP